MDLPSVKLSGSQNQVLALDFSLHLIAPKGKFARCRHGLQRLSAGGLLCTLQLTQTLVNLDALRKCRHFFRDFRDSVRAIQAP
jgi:hypothetical protein